MTEVPEPQIGPDDLLVQVRACGICGSDIHGFDRSTGRRIPPLIMGHEASGVVCKTGAEVPPLTPTTTMLQTRYILTSQFQMSMLKKTGLF